jgi:hypothetical protein
MAEKFKGLTEIKKHPVQGEAKLCDIFPTRKFFEHLLRIFFLTKGTSTFRASLRELSKI